MNSFSSRSSHPSSVFWAARTDGQPTAPARGGPIVDGAATPGLGLITLIAEAEKVMAVRLDLEAGYLQPGHVHPDHESIGFVLSGRLRMTVAGEAATLEPGDSWWHPRDTFHITEALEPSVAIEIHAPLRPDILERLGVQDVRTSRPGRIATAP
jgi:quercetin dioxygenase-like cupin family protein